MAIKNYYCVVDKQYTSSKKDTVAPRFVSIQVREHANKPKDSITRCDHADIVYTWFEDPLIAKE
jgi:hypothetical protein